MGGPIAGWYADPSGVFEHRWWDGARWTEQVSVAGRFGSSPVMSEVARAEELAASLRRDADTRSEGRGPEDDPATATVTAAGSSAEAERATASAPPVPVNASALAPSVGLPDAVPRRALSPTAPIELGAVNRHVPQPPNDAPMHVALLINGFAAVACLVLFRTAPSPTVVHVPLAVLVWGTILVNVGMVWWDRRSNPGLPTPDGLWRRVTSALFLPFHIQDRQEAFGRSRMIALPFLVVYMAVINADDLGMKFVDIEPSFTETLISQAYERELGLVPTVACPTESQPADEGHRFTCQVSAGPDRYVAYVQVHRGGHLSFTSGKLD